LTVDWTLAEKQDHSNATRWSAYRPRIDLAYDALSNDDDRLRVAFIVGRELAQRGLATEINAGLGEIGWQLRDNRLVPVVGEVRELFFPEHKQHDAYVEIRSILQKATTSITVVDPYVDDSILVLLSTAINTATLVSLFTAKFPADFVLEARKWISQHAVRLEIRTGKEFHDRFIVLDGVLCWHIGCSIKDAGKKAFMLSQVEDVENRKTLIEQIQRAWATGVVVV